MRANSLAFLLVGLGVGFGIMYPVMKRRAPEIVRAEPTPFVPAPSSSADLGIPAPPPLDVNRVKQLEDAIKKDPKDFDALTELGFLYFEQQQFDQAVAWYTKALQIKPDVAVQTDLGTSLYNLGRIDEAIAEFRKSLAVDPTQAQALFNLGVVLMEKKNDKQGAIELFQKLVDSHPELPDIDIVRQQIETLKKEK